jgi:hypothetical protein
LEERGVALEGREGIEGRLEEKGVALERAECFELETN